MGSEQFLWIIIGVLFGMVVGGAGGQALIRRTLKLPEATPDTDSTITSIVAKAAEAFRREVRENTSRLEGQLDKQNQQLSTLKETVAGFTSACVEKHKNIDRELSEMREATARGG